MSKLSIPDLTGNFTQIPNIVLDVWAPRFRSLSESQVILYLLRQTLGFHKSYEQLTVDDFVHGVKNSKGARLNDGCGLSESSVKQGIKYAIEDNFILKYRWGVKGKEKTIYFPNTEKAEIMVSLLEEGYYNPDRLMEIMISEKFEAMVARRRKEKEDNAQCQDDWE